MSGRHANGVEIVEVVEAVVADPLLEVRNSKPCYQQELILYIQAVAGRGADDGEEIISIMPEPAGVVMRMKKVKIRRMI